MRTKILRSFILCIMRYGLLVVNALNYLDSGLQCISDANKIRQNMESKKSYLFADT